MNKHRVMQEMDLREPNEDDYIQFALMELGNGEPVWYDFIKPGLGHIYSNIVVKPYLRDSFSKPSEADFNAKVQELKDAYPEIGDAFVDDANAETIYDVLSSLYENGFDAISIVVRQSRAKEISELALKANGQLYNFVMLNVIPVDERSIREQYIAGDIFQNGSFIESNGKVGQVFRRGANHLICMGEDKKVFRAWISDSKQVDKFILPQDF